MVDGHGGHVGFDNKLFTDSPGRRCLGVAVESNRKVFMYLQQINFPAVGNKIRQRIEFDVIKTLYGTLAGGMVNPHVGNSVEPLPGLGLNIEKILKRSQRPEISAHIFYGSLYFSFFVGCAWIASHRRYVEVTQKIKKGVVEADDRALPLDDRRYHIINQDFSGGSAKKREPVEQAVVKCLLFLAVSELHIQHAAVGFQYRQGIQFSVRVPVSQ